MRRDIFPMVVHLWKIPDIASCDYSWDKFERLKNGMHTPEIDRAVDYWAKAFHIADEWMIEAARDTMYMYGENWTDVKGEWPAWFQWPLINYAVF